MCVCVCECICHSHWQQVARVDGCLHFDFHVKKFMQRDFIVSHYFFFSFGCECEWVSVSEIRARNLRIYEVSHWRKKWAEKRLAFFPIESTTTTTVYIFVWHCQQNWSIYFFSIIFFSTAVVVWASTALSWTWKILVPTRFFYFFFFLFLLITIFDIIGICYGYYVLTECISDEREQRRMAVKWRAGT